MKLSTRQVTTNVTPITQHSTCREVELGLVSSGIGLVNRSYILMSIGIRLPFLIMALPTIEDIGVEFTLA